MGVVISKLRYRKRPPSGTSSPDTSADQNDLIVGWTKYDPSMIKMIIIDLLEFQVEASQI